MIRWCSKCLMPDTRPRMILGEDGVCPACKWAEVKKGIDWDARAVEFHQVLSLHRGRSGSPYDCVVPFSGGKDSATIAYRLKFEHGLNPLLVCYGQLLWTDVGRYNLHQVADAGFDIHYWRTNQAVSRKLARRFFIERGHPKQHYDAAVNAVPVRTAVQFGIPLVIYAEHGETEYGGHVLSEEHRRTRDLAEVLEHQVGDDPRNWAVDGISERDLYPYIYPEADEIAKVGVQAIYFAHYFKWDIYENAKLAKDKIGFAQKRRPTGEAYDPEDPRADSDVPGLPPWWGRSDGSFEGFDSIDDKIDCLDFWMMYLKFGFGRCVRMASRMIQNGHLTREQGLALVRAFDGEKPESYLTDILRYLSISHKELDEIADTHRNPEIWTKDETWRLKNPPI